MENYNLLIESILKNIGKVIIGKRGVLENILKGILAEGHILIEDVPGVGKTTIIKALAKSLNLSFSRIQFTPDLLPSDITGVSIYNQRDLKFQFNKGPIFSNIVLADEINRTSPKTQSALLEAMEEGQISEGNSTYTLQEPFIVLATQNPVEYEGTFLLPEAQLDRFIIRVSIGYPSMQHEINILETYRNNRPLNSINAVVDGSDIIELQKQTREIRVTGDINRYIVDIVNATRNSSYITLGASPRASLALLRVAQATALISGRSYVIPEDVKENVALVLAHRILLSSLGKSKGFTEEGILEQLINKIAAPKVV